MPIHLVKYLGTRRDLVNLVNGNPPGATELGTWCAPKVAKNRVQYLRGLSVLAFLAGAGHSVSISV